MVVESEDGEKSAVAVMESEDSEYDGGGVCASWRCRGGGEIWNIPSIIRNKFEILLYHTDCIETNFYN